MVFRAVQCQDNDTGIGFVVLRLDLRKRVVVVRFGELDGGSGVRHCDDACGIDIELCEWG